MLRNVLEDADHYFVRQKKEWTEIVVDFETRNQYEVIDATGQAVGTASEVSSGVGGFLKRNFFGSHRALDVRIHDAAGDPVIALSRAFFCHCTQCCKATGSSFATNAAVDAKHFRFVAGEELLSHFESSPGEYRNFCSGCGSPLVKTYANRPDVVRVRLGTLDDDPGIVVEGQYFVESKAPWVKIQQEIPSRALTKA